MIKIIYLILCFILGILIYQILKNNCECNIEGFGLFGRAKLEKCCPMNYMYSNTYKKCVKICDGCSMGAYGKMKLGFQKTYQTTGSKQGDEFVPHFECAEHDAKDVYDYDKINRLYKKTELKDQYNFGFTESILSESVSGSGVQAAEEGENEAWAGISTDAASSMGSYTADVSSDQGPFQEVPTGKYYTEIGECKGDYDTFIGMFPNRTELIKPLDCRGHWRLEMEDERYDYIKDNTESYFTPGWEIDRSDINIPEDLTPDEYHANNVDTINNIIKNIENEDSPVYKIYNDFIEEYDDPDRQSHLLAIQNLTNTLNINREIFCTSMGAIIPSISGEEADLNTIPLLNTAPLSYDDICLENKWDELCNNNISIQNISDKFISENSENNYLCNAQRSDNYLCPKLLNKTEIDTDKTFCP